MQALLGGVGVLKHVQADGAHQLAVEAARRHGNLRVIGDGLLRGAVELVQAQLLAGQEERGGEQKRARGEFEAPPQRLLVI